ncbi:MAG: type IV secretion system protein [Rickettsiales bacterium]|nr:type IV secretion system protein [Rickettsiales bacterium]
MCNIRDVTRSILILAVAILLSACGASCFEDVQFPSGAPPYIQKTATIHVSANSSNFISTSVMIPSGSAVTMNITGGPIFLCGKDNGVSSIAANNQQWTQVLGPSILGNNATVNGDVVTFTSGCNPDDNQPQCSNIACFPTTASVDCSVTPQNNLCNGSNTKVIPDCTQCQNANGQQCTYTGANGDPCVNNCTQQICSSLNQQYYNAGSCVQQYVSGPFSVNLNQWNWIIGNPGEPQAVNTFCQIQDYNNAFTPPANSQKLNPQNLWKYIGDGTNNNVDNKCWYTAGMGLGMKVVTDTSAPDCQSPGEETWFINNMLSSAQQQIPDPTDPNDYTMVSCSGSTNVGFQACANNLQNTVVQRVIKNKSAKFYCMKLIDIDSTYGDNRGGYNIVSKAQRCNAASGYPLTGSDGNNLGALYFTSSSNNQTQSIIQQGSIVGVPVVTLQLTDASGNPVSTNSGTQYFTTPQFQDSAYLLFGVYDAFYPDNLGAYTVNLSWKETVGGSGTISKAIEDLKDDLQSIVLAKIPQYYCKNTCVSDENCVDSSGVCTSPYFQYIRALLVLYIIFYGFAFTMGFTEISQKDLLIRVLKIGLVIQLISPGSWDFFNNTLFSLFINGTSELIHYATFTSCGGSTGIQCPPVFSFVDRMFDLLFLDPAIWIKILSVFFISPGTLVLGVLLIIGLFYFLIGILTAVAEYLMAIIAVAALLLLGPIFIPFILFEQTRSMFDTWIKMLFRYSMEPVFLLIGLSFLFEVYYALFREMFQFTACWKCMWGMNFPSSLTNVINEIFHISGSFLCVQGFGPWGMAPSGGGSPSGALGIDLPGLILIIVLSAVVRNYTEFVSAVMTKLIGQRSSIWKMTGGRRQKFKSPGEAVLHSLGVDKAEKAVNKSVRKGAFKALGLKTGDKEEQDKDLEKYENSLQGNRPGNNSRSTNIGSGKTPKGGV